MHQIRINISSALEYIKKELTKASANMNVAELRGDKNTMDGLRNKIDRFYTILYALRFVEDVMEQSRRMGVNNAKPLEETTAMGSLWRDMQSVEDAAAAMAKEICAC